MNRTTGPVLCCDGSRDFWLSWKGGNIEVVKSSQKCFIAIQEKVYIDQNNKTEAHSGLFAPLI